MTRISVKHMKKEYQNLFWQSHNLMLDLMQLLFKINSNNLGNDNSNKKRKYTLAESLSYTKVGTLQHYDSYPV